MELDELYQEVILDHGRRPRNFGRPEKWTHRAEGFNPMCGDRFVVYLEVEGEAIRRAMFEGQGCAISTASASLMTEALVGRPVQDFERLFDGVHRLLTSDDSPPEELGKLLVFGGVRNFPLRVKCASLAWHTSRAALAREEIASTE